MREYTMEDFKVNHKKCSFHETGHLRNSLQTWLSKDGFEINYSRILTNLIHNAARWCEQYASDLFIIWSSLKERLEDVNYTGEKLVLGFRDCGIDKNENVIRNFNNNYHYYRKIIVLEIEVNNVRIDMYM